MGLASRALAFLPKPSRVPRALPCSRCSATRLNLFRSLTDCAAGSWSASYGQSHSCGVQYVPLAIFLPFLLISVCIIFSLGIRGTAHLAVDMFANTALRVVSCFCARPRREPGSVCMWCAPPCFFCLSDSHKCCSGGGRSAEGRLSLEP
ncbi:hypothetical protein BV20DRAFT_533199 [Pilatotrama ljubarskyi]|nr:hypothetical protein BV20DRAFT_533199 [Pilatotrama ljubarskyi]